MMTVQPILPIQPNFLSLALGPHPQRELTLMPRLGSAWPRLSMAAGALEDIPPASDGFVSQPAPQCNCIDRGQLRETTEGGKNRSQVVAVGHDSKRLSRAAIDAD